jgi:tripartite-type tricarboxylate transporter receptor subunit TctC
MTRFKVSFGLAAFTLSAAAVAQNYPGKPIIFLSPAPGGALEAVQRAIIDKVRENTGATLVFEPKPGGGGAVALQALKAAVPDGYTFAIPWAGALTLSPLINKAQKIDPVKDFVPVTTMFSLAVMLATREDFPARDIRDLVAMARAKPESIRVGVFGSGNKAWMAMLEERTGAKFMLVPYKNSSEQMKFTSRPLARCWRKRAN